MTAAPPLDPRAALGRDDVELDRPRDASERDALAAILSLCFGVPETDLSALLERPAAEGLAPHDDLLVLRHGGEVVGGMKLVPMGQHFGGRAVPMTGLAAVGIAPERRGEGFGRALVRGTVARLASEGVILSALYPATVPLYRSGGYELSGSRFEHVLRLDTWSQRAGGLRVRRGSEADFAAMDRAQAAWAVAHDGTLARGDYIRQRVRRPRGETARHYLVDGADGAGPAAYASLTQGDRADGRLGYDLTLSDLVVREPEAGRRLLAFLSTHGSLAGQVTFFGGAFPELLGLLPEWRAQTRLAMHWMNRVLDLPAVLAARGYPPGLSAELHLELSDDLCTGHVGRHVLRVADGRGETTPGGRGELALSERGAAAILGGFVSPRAAARQGLLHGPPDALDRLGALLAGRGPFMAEMF